MGDATEVGIKLVVDDKSTTVEQRVKDGLAGVNAETLKVIESFRKMGDAAHKAGEERVEKMKRDFEGIGKALDAAGTAMEVEIGAVLALGVGLGVAADLAEKLALASMEAADAAQLQERTAAGMFNLAEGGKHSFDELHRYAAGVREDLEGIGIQSGVATGELMNTFEEVFARSKMSSEAAKDLTGDMALVGKEVPGGLRAISAGFEQLEAGIARPRNAVVQLISATNTLKGNAHEVAQQLMKMAPDKQMELAQEAIKKQAEMMRKGGFMAAPSLEELGTSFRDLRESFLESMGQPLLDEIVPKLVSLRDWLEEHAGSIKEFAGRVGDAFANVADGAYQVLGGLYEGIKRNWDSLSESFNRATKLFERAFHDAVGDSETIGDTLGRAADAIAKALETGMDVAEGLYKAAHFFAEQIPILGSLVKQKDSGDAYQAAKKTTSQSDSAFAEAKKQYEVAAAMAHDDADQIKLLSRALDDMHNSAVKTAGELDTRANQGDTTAISDFQAYLNQSIKTNDEGMQYAAIHMLSDSFMLQDATIKGAGSIEGGFDHFIHMLEAKAPELAEKLKKMGDVVKGEGGVSHVGGPSTNFFGGQTFNIKQDFKDQDPDRIIVTFRRDLVRQAEARRMARVGTPFGP